MAKIQPVWALDVGQAALKALKLVPGETPGLVVAEAFDYVEYPKILSQPDADPEQLIREALETFLERNELKGCKVAIAVPGQAGLVKFIKLPPVEKKRIPDIVKFEAKQQIPFSLDEVIWAYQQIGDEEEGGDEDFTMAEVGLFAMKRDQINKAILPMRVAGIEVDIVQMGPIALYNFITFDRIKEGPTPAAAPGVEDAETDAGQAKPAAKGEKGSIVLLDIGADNTDLIITDGTRIWQRNVPIGGNHFTRALTKELKLTFAKAEHLKRNATKAPDPRSIFTAMRGVFNDFASEVNRSIGFYSSVNRTAKISKVIGLGNGFKLPGLQKFLQQNLSHEVEKLEEFARMVGDDVKTAPQFLENLPSFGVAYGLGVQGLNKSGLRTNLLPPEIEQVRLIRAKKPWALAASALLMLGFSGLFLGDYRVFAKVDRQEFKDAVAAAKSATDKGAKYASDFASAKTAWQTTFDQGKSLVAGATDRAKWPVFLKTINEHLPDPEKEYKLDPNKPFDQPKLDKLRVHVDAIKPAWRSDLAAGWFNLEPPEGPSQFAKNTMHPIDLATPPTGVGWVIQLVGHHYNPRPSAEELRLPEAKRTEYGPYTYLVRKVLPGLMTPDLRLYGIRYVNLAWMTIDTKWTNEGAVRTNGLASNAVPILDRATAPVTAEASGSGSGGSNPMMEAMARTMAKGAAGGMQGGSAPGMDPRMMMSMMEANMGMMGGVRPPAEDKNVVKLTRTDFLIQFVWQPAEEPKTDEERKTKLDEIVKQLTEKPYPLAISSAQDLTKAESSIADASLKQSQDVTKALVQGAAAPPGQPGAVAKAPVGVAPPQSPGQPGIPPGTPAPPAATVPAPGIPGTPAVPAAPPK